MPCLPLSPVASTSPIGTSSSYSPSLDPYSSPLSMQIPSSYSSSFTCKEIIRSFPLAALYPRRVLSVAGGNLVLLYLARVFCIDPSMPANELAHVLRLLKVSVERAPITNRTQLESKRRIVSKMPTGRTLVALSWAMRQNAILNQMSSQGGLIVS